MSHNKFKVGDNVICTDNNHVPLVLHKSYNISFVLGDMVFVNDYWFYFQRFSTLQEYRKQKLMNLNSVDT